ncbi:MAG: hypothetical protein ACIAQU_04440 [Phycisphaerales bacterium JB064]
MLWPNFASDFDAEHGLLLRAPGQSERQIDLWYAGPLTGLLDRLAVQLAASWHYDGQAVTFTPDAGERVQESRFVTPEDAVALINAVYPEAGAASAGGRVAIGPQAPAAAAELVKAINATPSSWLLDVLLVELNQSTARELGLGWSLGATLSARADAGTGLDATSGPVLGARAAAVAEVIARLSAESSLARLSHRGTLYLVDGVSAELNQGDTIPVPQRTVSPEGTVTVTGFSEIQTGFTLVAIASDAGDVVRLELQPTVSEVAGFVLNEAPIVLSRSLQSVALVRPGEWLVIGGFDRVLERDSAFGIDTSSPWTSSQRRSEESVTIIMLARLTNVR